MRWSESITLEFVKIYLRHECLWNPAQPGYKVKYQREKAYVDICSEFNTSTTKTLTVPEVKLKIKNLRTTYAQQVHKILQKSSPDSIYEPSLIWFNEMDRCLKNIPSNRHSTSYNHVIESSEVDSSTKLWADNENKNSNLNPDPLIPQTDEHYYNKEESNEFSNVTLEESSCVTPYKRFKKKKVKHSIPTEQSFPDRNLIEITSTCAAKEDEFEIYGKFIASQLRSIDLQKALKLQLEIHNLVNEARISDINSY